jgi:hypothetical protein
MQRKDLELLARARIREARVLLRAGEYAGAYYLSGLAVECAIKACIAKQTKRHEFPNKHRAIDAFDHDPVKLAKLAGIYADLLHDSKAHPQLAKNWTIVKDWSVDSRYATRTRADAEALFRAIVTKSHGVFRWLRHHW